jgi:hypothetical protein
MEISRGIPQFYIDLDDDEMFYVQLPWPYWLARQLQAQLILIDPNRGAFRLSGIRSRTWSWMNYARDYRDVSEVPDMPEEVAAAINQLLHSGTMLAQEARELGVPG